MESKIDAESAELNLVAKFVHYVKTKVKVGFTLIPTNEGLSFYRCLQVLNSKFEEPNLVATDDDSAEDRAIFEHEDPKELREYLPRIYHDTEFSGLVAPIVPAAVDDDAVLALAMAHQAIRRILLDEALKHSLPVDDRDGALRRYAENVFDSGNPVAEAIAQIELERLGHPVRLVTWSTVLGSFDKPDKHVELQFAIPHGRGISVAEAEVHRFHKHYFYIEREDIHAPLPIINSRLTTSSPVDGAALDRFSLDGHAYTIQGTAVGGGIGPPGLPTKIVKTLLHRLIVFSRRDLEVEPKDRGNGIARISNLLDSDNDKEVYTRLSGIISRLATRV